MILRITVRPNARKNELIADKEGNIKVKIKAPPVDGKANKELISFLSEIYHVPKSYIEIISGETSSKKTIRILNTKAQSQHKK